MRNPLIGILFCLLSVLASISISPAQQQPFHLPEGVTDGDYIPGTIIYKLKAGPALQIRGGAGLPLLEEAFSRLGIQSSQRIYPSHQTPSDLRMQQEARCTDLSGIYECVYTGGASIETAVNTLLSTGLIEYAQPRYIVTPMSYVPNDPMNVNQYHLVNMKMFDAWDIERGDTNIVVGICDWGMDMNHVDLKNNIKYNYDDPIDGIDNDNDGYVDNFRGWDMGSNDNDPTGIIVHGTYTSGYSSASTDNGAGVSGTGFRCKFIHVKVADDNNIGTRGYEGIVYAADHGCKVINCSWGSPFFIGPYGQDIINYATFNCGALVFAASGNDNSLTNYYPASYDYVMNVAATNITDGKWISGATSGSSYGYKVDLCAPGSNVWTTSPGGTYNSSSGTSFSSPLAAGAAALLWSKYPSNSNLQIAARLKASCDLIDTLAANLTYKGLLGAGRINMYRALTDTTTPYVEMMSPVFTDADGDGVFEKGDTVFLSGDFINFLSATGSGIVAELSSKSAYVSMMDSVFYPGQIQTLQSVSNFSSPFAFRISQNSPPSQSIVLKVTITDSAWSGFQYLSLTVNSDYLTLDTNRIAFTLTSNGGLGYNKGNSLQGVGFTYNDGVSLMSNGGFLVGISESKVMDAIIGFTGSLDQDFASLVNVKKIQNPVFADYEAEGSFDDSPAGLGKIGLRVTQKAFAWVQESRSRFIIVELEILNQSGNDLTNLYAGCFMDWDLLNQYENSADYDAQRRLAYVYPYSGGIHAGMMMINPATAIPYAFDVDGANVSIDLEDGFSGFEKYYAMKTSRFQAGNFYPGNNVASMLSSGPYQVPGGDTVKLTYAFLAGDFLADLQQIADSALAVYQGVMGLSENTGAKDECRIYPNPVSALLYISNAEQRRLVLCDIAGNQLFATIVSSNPFPLDLGCYKPGLYFLKLGDKSYKVVVQ